MIFIVAFIFWVMENNFFGWNSYPKSEAELICDGIVCLIVAIGISGVGR